MSLRGPVSTDGKDASLRTELTALQKQQWDTLEHATYVGMTAEQARQYEHRACRIVELQRTLT